MSEGNGMGTAMRRVFLGGRMVPEDQAMVSPLGDGFMYGAGLFETMRLSDGQVVFFADHEERLTRGAARLDLAPPLPGARERAESLAGANGLRNGGIKWILYRDRTGTGELIVTLANRYGPERYERGFSLRTARPDGVAGRGGSVKTLNYLENIRARRVAEAEGADEALFLSEDGRVLEGATTNVFMVQGGKVFTPPLDGSILPGVTRARVLWLGDVVQSVIGVGRLLEADEVFVTNALLGIMPVARIDDREFSLTANEVTRSLRRSLEDAARE